MSAWQSIPDLAGNLSSLLPVKPHMALSQAWQMMWEFLKSFSIVQGISIWQLSPMRILRTNSFCRAGSFGQIRSSLPQMQAHFCGPLTSQAMFFWMVGSVRVHPWPAKTFVHHPRTHQRRGPQKCKWQRGAQILSMFRSVPSCRP